MMDWIDGNKGVRRMSNETEPKFERTLRRGRIEEERQDPEFFRYWRARSVSERFAEIERLRQAMHGNDYATARRLSRPDLRLQRRRMSN